MKQILIWITILLSISKAYSCTNLLVTRGASEDGSVFVSYAADSHTLYGELYFWPAADHEEGSMLPVYEWDTGKYLGEIPQVAHTYQVTGNVNEHQVVIGETTFGGRKDLQDTTGILDYGSLMYITLQRAKTAREAIEIMDDLVTRYGYCSSGESFSIADSREVWLMEMIGKGLDNKGAVWIARRIPEGYISAHANQARINYILFDDQDNCLFSHDVISFAREKGYFSGRNNDFSFANAYAPLDFEAQRFCEARVWSFFNRFADHMDAYIPYVKGETGARLPLWVMPNRKLNSRDIQTAMRDHFEGTPFDMTKDIGAGSFACPYRWRPLTWEVDSAKYINERAIATQQTGFSFVAQLRDRYPSPLGAILWFGVDDAATSVYIPVFAGIKQVPESIKVGNGDLLTFSWNSAFWVFNWVANMAYSKYSYMIEDIIPKQKMLEDKFHEEVELLTTDLHHHWDTKQDSVLQVLTKFTSDKAAESMEEWSKLGQFLMVRYIDGNVKKVENGTFKRNAYGQPAYPDQPGYSKDYYHSIKEQTGDKLKMPE